MSFDDARVQFYLRHREQLEEWQALRGETASAVDEWLTSIGTDIEALARTLGADVQMYSSVDDGDKYPMFRLSRRSWPDGDGDGDAVSVALEWVRGSTTLSPGHQPYVGVRSPRETPIGARLRDSAAIRDQRRQRKDAASTWWVAYAYVSPGPEFPSSPDEYRNTLVAAIREAWKAYAPLIDREAASMGAR